VGADRGARRGCDANHYVFDIAAGLLVSVAGYVVGPLVSRWISSRRFKIPRAALGGRPVAEAAA
jgi:hypothetical protein